MPGVLAYATGRDQGGALDWVAMHWANWLLGNPLAAPVVEVALGGFCVVAEQDCVLAPPVPTSMRGSMTSRWRPGAALPWPRGSG